MWSHLAKPYLYSTKIDKPTVLGFFFVSICASLQKALEGYMSFC